LKSESGNLLFFGSTNHRFHVLTNFPRMWINMQLPSISRATLSLRVQIGRYSQCAKRAVDWA
jgi:hypothetical protein